MCLAPAWARVGGWGPSWGRWSHCAGQGLCSRFLVFTVCFGGGEGPPRGVCGCLSVRFEMHRFFSVGFIAPAPSLHISTFLWEMPVLWEVP